VSELVTNSVQHAGLSADEFVRAGAAVSEGVLRLEVDSPGITGTIAALPDSGPGAFGLLQSQSHLIPRRLRAAPITKAT
jgi:two-component sensor histidine kinase